MATVGMLEAKTQLSALADRAVGGEEIVITRHGKPLVKIVPAVADRKVDAEELLRRMREGRTATLGGLDWKALRDEGRM